ncbi:MAG: Rne/Rng family ribonuclease [Planctomycetota bacterium]
MVEDGVLEELYLERSSQDNFAGNIYKGKIVNIEPSIQAAFVDFGVGRNGFLHVSDIDSIYYRHLENGSDRERDRDDDRRKDKPPIQEIFRRGSEVLVQVIKEGIGTKGPTLSTYISIPGRYLVLMPSLGRVGVSRKIEDEDARRKLKRMMKALDPPEGLGFIIRTAGMDRSREDLSRDLHYLCRLWKTIHERLDDKDGLGEIYEESDMMLRTIRDIFNAEIDTVYIDEPGAYERARGFMKLVMPAFADRVKLYSGPKPLFQKYDIDGEIKKIQCRTVPLKGGGSLVIEQTEALVAIDVNSGSSRIDSDPERNAYKVNLKAADEIARQLRLRDLGGVICNDFIDMRDERHRRGVERALEEAVERDRARTKIHRTSPFGLIEMTRQRIRPSLRRSIYQDCPCCNGSGMVKTAESMAIDVVRAILKASTDDDVARIGVEVHERVAHYLYNRKRRDLTRIEEERDIEVLVESRGGVGPEHLVLRVSDDNGRDLKHLSTADSSSMF